MIREDSLSYLCSRHVSVERDIFFWSCRADHITVLKLEEESVVFCEEHLSHHVVIFDHFKQVNYVKISVEHLYTFF